MLYIVTLVLCLYQPLLIQLYPWYHYYTHTTNSSVYTKYICIILGQPTYISWTTFLDSCLFDKCFISIVNTSFCIMCSVCKCSWWWDVHICIYFVSSVVFVDFLIKSSFKKKTKKTRILNRLDNHIVYVLTYL